MDIFFCSLLLFTRFLSRNTIREPERRISLEDIEQHAWMQHHERLVTFSIDESATDHRGVLKGEDHQSVLRKMHQVGLGMQTSVRHSRSLLIFTYLTKASISPPLIYVNVSVPLLHTLSNLLLLSRLALSHRKWRQRSLPTRMTMSAVHIFFLPSSRRVRDLETKLK